MLTVHLWSLCFLQCVSMFAGIRHAAVLYCRYCRACCMVPVNQHPPPSIPLHLQPLFQACMELQLVCSCAAHAHALHDSPEMQSLTL